MAIAAVQQTCCHLTVGRTCSGGSRATTTQPHPPAGHPPQPHLLNPYSAVPEGLPLVCPSVGYQAEVLGGKARGRDSVTAGRLPLASLRAAPGIS